MRPKRAKILLILRKNSPHFFVPFCSLENTNCHIKLVYYIYRLILRTEQEEEEGKEDGIGGRRGDFDHARVFVLRE